MEDIAGDDGVSCIYLTILPADIADIPRLGGNMGGFASEA